MDHCGFPKVRRVLHTVRVACRLYVVAPVTHRVGKESLKYRHRPPFPLILRYTSTVYTWMNTKSDLGLQYALLLCIAVSEASSSCITELGGFPAGFDRGRRKRNACLIRSSGRTVRACHRPNRAGRLEYPVKNSLTPYAHVTLLDIQSFAGRCRRHQDPRSSDAPIVAGT